MPIYIDRVSECKSLTHVVLHAVVKDSLVEFVFLSDCICHCVCVYLYLCVPPTLLVWTNTKDHGAYNIVSAPKGLVSCQ